MGRTDDVAHHPLPCMGERAQLAEDALFNNGVDILPLPDDVPDRVGILDVALRGGALVEPPLVLDRGRADEAYLVALLLGEEGDLPPVVAGRLHADQDIVELMLLLGLHHHRLKKVKALPRIVDRGDSAPVCFPPCP